MVVVDAVAGVLASWRELIDLEWDRDGTGVMGLTEDEERFLRSDLRPTISVLSFSSRVGVALRFDISGDDGGVVTDDVDDRRQSTDDFRRSA